MITQRTNGHRHVDETAPPSGTAERGGKQFEQLINAAPEYAVFMLDPGGHLTGWSVGAERVTGYRADEILGKHFSAFYRKEDRDDRVPEQALETTARDGKYEAPTLLVRRDESRFMASIVIQSLRDASGRSIGFAAIARDIQEQRQQQALERVHAKLVQTQKREALVQLSRGFAHEFNNILQAIDGAVEVLRRRLAHVDSSSSGMIDMIKRGVARGTEITHRLLAFSRCPPFEARPINPDEFVASMVDVLRQTLCDGVTIDTVLGAGSTWVCTDANQLETAIMNLAINARDAMPQGGTLTIETANVCLEEVASAVNDDVVPGPYVMIAMSDTGTGMTREMIAKTFEPFFVKELGYGAGRGLSQVYEFVERSHGHVAIESEL